MSVSTYWKSDKLRAKDGEDVTTLSELEFKWKPAIQIGKLFLCSSNYVTAIFFWQ